MQGASVSLHFRLFLVAVAVILAHAGIRISIIEQQARDSAVSFQREQGHLVAKALANSLTNALIANDFATVRNTVDLLYTSDHFDQLLVTDERGRAIADKQLAEMKLGTDVPKWFAANLALPAIPGHHSISAGGVGYGTVTVTLSRNQIMRRAWESTTREAGLAILELLTLVALFWGLLRFGFRPLDQLSATVRRIGSGEFGARMRQNTVPEFRELVGVVNDMAQKLQNSDEERQASEDRVRRLNEELEARVDVRTQELASANEMLAHQALHDGLTDLPNRSLLYDRVQQALLACKRDIHVVALFIMDLDRFKEINDTMGHHSGDLVLKTVAGRLLQAVRATDTAARLGGDEFAVVLPSLPDSESAVQLAKTVLHAVQQPILLGGRTIDVGASLGIALYPAHGEDAATLIQRADMAMYMAKRAHNGYWLYSGQSSTEGRDRLSLHSELRRAIETGQLELYYQPKVDCGTNAVSDAEALLRWNHPRHGLIMPDQFIPLAESTGLIRPLTAWVVKRALSQCREWWDEGLEIHVAVNISAVNLQDPEFPGEVERFIDTCGARPQWLELEITETAVMLDPAVAIEAIKRLHDMGVTLAIDDFGTGYSSMAYLQKLLIAKIKIDRSFVLNMTTNKSDAVIVRSLIGLAHNLGLKVVAEGVETQDTWDELRSLGCDGAQGYFMSRPVPPGEFVRWLTSSSWAGRSAGGGSR